MRLQQLDVDKKPKIMIIPMIDIIFFLLVFFMMSMLTMVVQKSISLNLPQTVTSKLEIEKALPVAVTSDGQIYVEQEKIPRETFRRRMEIEKTNRMNALFEFYAALLTDKQMNYIELYYADDYSLAEIAEEFGVSRQAVYDNIKRTEKILEAYEMKLHMYSDYIVRSQIFDDIMEKYADDSYLQEQIAILSSIDNRD